jgi:hypothetical protein
VVGWKRPSLPRESLGLMAQSRNAPQAFRKWGLWVIKVPPLPPTPTPPSLPPTHTCNLMYRPYASGLPAMHLSTARHGAIATAQHSHTVAPAQVDDNTNSHCNAAGHQACRLCRPRSRPVCLSRQPLFRSVSPALACLPALQPQLRS